MINQIYLQNIPIRYSDNGRGKVIVFLHGYLESLDVWSELTTELTRKYRVISIDLPGFGASGIQAEVHTMELMADLLNHVLKALKVERCSLFGHSLGGYIALAFVEKYASKVKRFCLFHSHPFADSEVTINKRNREIELVKAGHKQLFLSLSVNNAFTSQNIERLSDTIANFNQIALQASDDGIVAALEGMKQRQSRVAIIEQTNLPFLYIIGRHDNFISMEMLDKIKFNANAEIVIFENSGHSGFVEEKEKTVELIKKFVG